MSALKYWLWLTELPGLTNQTRLALLQHFPTPEDVYYAEAEEVLLTEGITREQAILLENKNCAAWPEASTPRRCGAPCGPAARWRRCWATARM